MIRIQQSSHGEDNSSAARPTGKLLIVDDEEDLLFTLQILFSPYYDVRTASSGKRALEIIHGGFIPQVILADQRMPEMSGAEFLAESMRIVPQTVRVVLTGYTDARDIAESINRGNVYRFLTKPWRNNDLLEIIRACFEHYYLSEEKIALARALEQVQTLSREKMDMLDLVIHDLKNPVNVIIGLADLMQSGEDLGFTTESYQEFGGEIARSARRMFSLIQNLLHLHALESGTVKTNAMPINLSALVELIASDFQRLAAGKNIALHVSPQTNDIIIADEMNCHHIVENLLSNAIKYSFRGGNVWVETARRGEVLRFSVRDEGQGVSEADKAQMFQKFRRLSAQPTAGESSTGLGLAIVKKVAESMNAKVWCESEPGKGATFIVEFLLA
jgi:signal transduction histidine kinase